MRMVVLINRQVQRYPRRGKRNILSRSWKIKIGACEPRVVKLERLSREEKGRVSEP